jgi:hypothetical protein
MVRTSDIARSNELALPNICRESDAVLNKFNNLCSRS